MKIELTGDQLQDAIADYLSHGNPSALLNRVAAGLEIYAAKHADRAPGEAAWDQWVAGRVRLAADLERRLEDDFYCDANNNKIAEVETIQAADAILLPWFESRGVTK